MDYVEFQTLFDVPIRNGVYKAKEFQGRGVRLVKMNQLFGERKLRSLTAGYELIELTEAEKQTRLLQRNDLLFSRTSVVADGVGKCSIVEEVHQELTWDSNIIRVRLDPQLSCPHFYFYFFNSPQGRDVVKRLSSGASVTTITGSGLSASNVPSPSIPRQQRIASILSSYDELIENSQRRIKILESMASGLYREWFVNFRFPGHEGHPRVASVLGEIPKGWEVVAFTEVADVLSGGTPKTDMPAFWNGDIPFFTPRDAPSCFYVEDAERHVTELGLSNCASALYPPDTVFITARGTVGKVAMPSIPMAMSQSCYALRGKNGCSQRFLFLMTVQQVDYLKTNTGGATFDTIVVDTFRRMKVTKPPLHLISSFVGKVDALLEQVSVLQRQIRNLRRTRDLLLPRLLSGQIRLSEVE